MWCRRLSSTRENEARKKSSDALHSKLKETQERLMWTRNQLTELTVAASAFKSVRCCELNRHYCIPIRPDIQPTWCYWCCAQGIGRLYGSLNGLSKDEEVPGLAETNMIRYLGVVEQQVFGLFKLVLQQKASPAKRMTRSRSKRSLRDSDDDDTSSLRQGPNIKTGTLTKNITSRIEPPAVSTLAALAADEKEDEDPSGLSRPLSTDQLRKLTMTMHSTEAGSKLLTPKVATATSTTAAGARRARARKGRGRV